MRSSALLIAAVAVAAAAEPTVLLHEVPPIGSQDPLRGAAANLPAASTDTYKLLLYAIHDGGQWHGPLPEETMFYRMAPDGRFVTNSWAHSDADASSPQLAIALVPILFNQSTAVAGGISGSGTGMPPALSAAVVAGGVVARPPAIRPSHFPGPLQPPPANHTPEWRARHRAVRQRRPGVGRQKR